MYLLYVIHYLALLVSQFQAITWGILCLLGILVYTGDIKVQPSTFATDRFQMVLVNMYFNRAGKCMA